MSMTDPITPPDELLDHCCAVGMAGNWRNALTISYRAGADQELEACAKWVNTWCTSRYLGDAISADVLRAARRPKPPTLKEQAIRFTETYGCRGGVKLTPEQCDTIRRALNELPND